MEGRRNLCRRGNTYDDYERSLNYIDDLGVVRKEQTFVGKLRSLKSQYLAELRKIMYLENRYVIPCTAGDRIGVLYSNGDVAPCELLNDRFGNIRAFDYSFPKMWQTKRAADTQMDYRYQMFLHPRVLHHIEHCVQPETAC